MKSSSSSKENAERREDLVSLMAETERIAREFSTDGRKREAIPKDSIVDQALLEQIASQWPDRTFNVFTTLGRVVFHCLISSLRRGLRFEYDIPRNRDDEFAFHKKTKARIFGKNTPYYYIIETFLGPRALSFFFTKSLDGVGKLQPHDISRENWVRLTELERQIDIENELARFPLQA